MPPASVPASMLAWLVSDGPEPVKIFTSSSPAPLRAAGSPPNRPAVEVITYFVSGFDRRNDTTLSLTAARSASPKESVS